MSTYRKGHNSQGGGLISVDSLGSGTKWSKVPQKENPAPRTFDTINISCSTLAMHATDLFDWKGVKYLLIVDYYSRFIEMVKPSGESSAEVIRHTKSIFARYRVPQEVISDNGLQFSSRKFKVFTCLYGFSHTMNSPRFPQSNGEVEYEVKTVKGLL